MKALAIDCAVTRLIVAAKNDDNMCAAVYDIGMKQSETIVNAVDSLITSAKFKQYINAFSLYF